MITSVFNSIPFGFDLDKLRVKYHIELPFSNPLHHEKFVLVASTSLFPFIYDKFYTYNQMN